MVYNLDRASTLSHIGKVIWPWETIKNPIITTNNLVKLERKFLEKSIGATQQ